ncbi:MAG: dual OB domain-containing protein [Mariniphaga sp.]
MEVLIVAKTHLSEGVCIGALDRTGRFLRLLDENGGHQHSSCPFEVKQVWEVTSRKAGKQIPPHVEDVKVLHKEYRRMLREGQTMLRVLEMCNIKLWKGSPEVLFDGCLLWTNRGSGYVSRAGGIPRQSVGFWLSDKDLLKYNVYEKIRYRYPDWRYLRSLPYVGFETPEEIIPAGTLLRVSLARWWDKEGETEERCSLQLSGWYDIQQAVTAANQLNEGNMEVPW